MPQQEQKIRPLFLIALGLAIVVGGGLFIRQKLRKPPMRVAQTQPTTRPTTKPSTLPSATADAGPPRTYTDLIAQNFPKLSTTQPIDQGLNMRDWGHFPMPYPAYVDRRGGLWITRSDAEATDAVLASAPTRQG